MKAMNLGLGYINLKGLPIVAEALKVIDEGTAKQHNMVCFLYKKGEEIRLATTGMDNNEQGLVERIKQDYPGLRVVVFLTSEDSVEAALKLYSALPRRVERIDDIKVLEKEIWALAGEEFNIASTQQMAEILYKKLKISTDEVKKIKTGLSTAAGELEKLKKKIKEIIDEEGF